MVTCDQQEKFCLVKMYYSEFFLPIRYLIWRYAELNRLLVGSSLIPLNTELTQLAIRSLRPEHFSTSEVVLHTCGPTQTVAKYVPYRWSIKYLFVWKGAKKRIKFYLRPYTAIGIIKY